MKAEKYVPLVHFIYKNVTFQRSSFYVCFIFKIKVIKHDVKRRHIKYKYDTLHLTEKNVSGYFPPLVLESCAFLCFLSQNGNTETT